MLVGYVVGQVGALLPKLVLGLWVGEVFSLALVACAGLAGVLLAVTSLFWRRSGLAAGPWVGVNAVWYLTPLLALVWLWCFSRLGVARVDYLVVGAVLVVAAGVYAFWERGHVGRDGGWAVLVVVILTVLGAVGMLVW